MPIGLCNELFAKLQSCGCCCNVVILLLGDQFPIMQKNSSSSWNPVWQTSNIAWVAVMRFGADIISNEVSLCLKRELASQFVMILMALDPANSRDYGKSFHFLLYSLKQIVVGLEVVED